jgi:rod shape-determining protein MreD
VTGTAVQRIDRAGRNIVPVVMTFLLVVVQLAPVPAPGWGVLAPNLALASVWYWAIHRADLLRPSHAFLLGLVQDLLAGTPLGLSALVHVLVFAGVERERRLLSRGSFYILWLGFAVAALGASAVSWAAVSALALAPAPPAPGLLHALATAAAFPLVAAACIRIHRAFLVVPG